MMMIFKNMKNDVSPSTGGSRSQESGINKTHTERNFSKVISGRKEREGIRYGRTENNK